MAVVQGYAFASAKNLGIAFVSGHGEVFVYSALHGVRHCFSALGFASIWQRVDDRQGQRDTEKRDLEGLLTKKNL